MKSIEELEVGFGDAESYLQRQNREYFNFVFVHNKYLDQVLEPNRFFLIGEKGTGKTAYSAFLSNNKGYKNYISTLKFIRETEYAKFINLKRKNNLDLSDYTDVWLVILLLLFAGMIESSNIEDNVISRSLKFKAIQSACNEFYATAFAPEIAEAIRFVEESKVTAELVNKWLGAKIGTVDENSVMRSSSVFQTNLLYLRRMFVEALGRLRLKNNLLLFIDGIDIRPGEIPYKEYLDCVKGLSNAIWRLNTDVFPQFRDTNGRMKVVMLIRPDIFNSLSFQNVANKIHDNAVFLDWNTTYADYRTSDLFRLSNKMLMWRQDDVRFPDGIAWDDYFPWSGKDINPLSSHNDNSFIHFLKSSYCRPRDIVSAISFLKDAAMSRGLGKETMFSAQLVCGMEFRNQYSEFLLSGIRDQLSFYYTEEEYQVFRNFFMFLEGRCDFSYEIFKIAFARFSRTLDRGGMGTPQFLSAPEVFLQFLYDMNVLAYKERTDKGNFFRWCYRERTTSNMSPRVELDGSYTVHYGLRRALNLGNARRISR